MSLGYPAWRNGMYALPFPNEVQCLSPGERKKKKWATVWEARKNSSSHFYLIQSLTDHLWPLRPGYVADIFSKLKKVNLSLHGKQLTVFVASDKFKVAGKKIRISDVLHLPLTNLMGSQHLNNSFLSWRWTGRPGVLRSTGSQRVGHDWATELNWMTSAAMLISVRLLALLLLSLVLFWLSRSYTGKKETSRLQLCPGEGTNKKLGRNSIFQHMYQRTAFPVKPPDDISALADTWIAASWEIMLGSCKGPDAWVPDPRWLWDDECVSFQALWVVVCCSSTSTQWIQWVCGHFCFYVKSQSVSLWVAVIMLFTCFSHARPHGL